MGRRCSTREGDGKCVQNFGCKSMREGDHLEELDAFRRMVLKWILWKWGWRL